MGNLRSWLAAKGPEKKSADYRKKQSPTGWGGPRRDQVRMSETSPRPALTFWRIWRCFYRTSVDYILGMEHRAALYIDDLSESQQETVRSIVETLRREFLKEES